MRYIETTSFILFWCLILAIPWSFCVYWMVARWHDHRHGEQRHWWARALSHPHQGTGLAMVCPTLLVAPLTLVGAYHGFGINLLYPLHLTASVLDLARAAVVPAVLLLLTSGFLGSLFRSICLDYPEWRAKYFVRVGQVYGRSASRSLYLVVLIGGFCRSLGQSLPWLFGDLIVIECVFNAPGLGLDAWHQAKTHNWWGVAEALFGLALLYGILVLISGIFMRWLGARLESYQ